MLFTSLFTVIFHNVLAMLIHWVSFSAIEFDSYRWIRMINDFMFNMYSLPALSVMHYLITKPV